MEELKREQLEQMSSDSIMDLLPYCIVAGSGVSEIYLLLIGKHPNNSYQITYARWDGNEILREENHSFKQLLIDAYEKVVKVLKNLGR